MPNIEATADWSSLGIPTRPADPLKETIAALAGCWVRSRCPCGRRAYLPLRMMGSRVPAGTRLSDLLPRLRCETCDARPATVDLVPDAANDASGVGNVAAWFWKVEFHLDKDGHVRTL